MAYHVGRMPQRVAGKPSFLNDLLQSIADQGRGLVARAIGPAIDDAVREQPLEELAAALLSSRGEASGVAIAREIMRRYRRLDETGRLAFLRLLERRFAPDPQAIREAFRRFEAAPSSEALRALNAAVEPPRQELIRRLNLAPGNTLGLVRMREDLLDALRDHPELADMDADFQHLFGSWFNRGFLVMKRIEWSTPAHILEKIIRYEAVHAIESWDDLRRRLEPPDRRCFAFFHPALADEPLIFVEVALTQAIPDAIGPILAAKRAQIEGEAATTAVFYSISNCQRGLARISFGNFLIKQVAEELKRECPGLQPSSRSRPFPAFVAGWPRTSTTCRWSRPSARRWRRWKPKRAKPRSARPGRRCARLPVTTCCRRRGRAASRAILSSASISATARDWSGSTSRPTSRPRA